MKRTGLVVAVGAAVLSLAACSGGSADPATTPPALTTSASPGASEPFAPAQADTIAIAVAQSVPSAGDVTAITDDNDPDGMGRPSGSTSAAVISDSGGNRSGKEPSVSWGAAVEVFETAEQAQARSDFIQGIVEDNPILGSEYLYVSANVLLRVSGELKPSVAAQYEAAFRAVA